jgi:hypothetical protein
MACTENIVHVTPVNALPPLNIGVFFDGTGNDNERPDELSNVWYLYDMHKGDDEKFKQKNYILRKFYQRGVGSDSGSSPFNWAVDTAGNAGGYGAAVRFENVLSYIELYLIDYKNKFDRLPSIIVLDIFGFSRGAAMARHFVNCIKQDYFDFEDPEINKAFSNRNISINFLGIFDTVGSFGMAGDNDDFGFSFYIDPSWIKAKAVHIYALNEYRWGFDLQALIPKQDTNYPIDIIEDNFIEISLPGAHSDIGGGYYYNKKTQFSDNSLLACPPLELMIKHATDNRVPLNCTKNDQARRDAGSALKDKEYSEMLACCNIIKPYMENNSLRSPIGLWREHTALSDILLFKLDEANEEFKDLWDDDENYYQLQSEIQTLERKIKSVNIKIELSEQQLKDLFNNDNEFENFKIYYDILYQNYMHRSHAPFNTVFGMGRQDADENTSFWNRSISDDRPHRDIFYNSFKDFEKINAKRTKPATPKNHKHGAKKQQAAPEYKILNSISWEDPAV